MVGQIQQKAVRVGFGEVFDQARHHEVVIQHRIVIAVVGGDLVIAQPGRCTGTVGEFVEGRRVAVLITHVSAEQVNHDEFAWCAVRQDLVKGLQDIAVILAGILVAVVIEVDLLVSLLGEGGEHGVAFGHGLLVGDPEGFVTRLFHHADQRRSAEVQVRVFFVGEGQHLLQGFDGVRTRRDDVVKDRQLVAQLVQVGRGFARVTVQAHALAVGGLTDDQYQGCRLACFFVCEVGERRDFAGAGEHALHAVQLLQITTISDHHLPRHGWFYAAFEAFES